MGAKNKCYFILIFTLIYSQSNIEKGLNKALKIKAPKIPINAIVRKYKQKLGAT
jgi:hypothetical protein|nr:MAG TPA: hypothetical protein [Caudoviricetes sp.]